MCSSCLAMGVVSGQYLADDLQCSCLKRLCALLLRHPLRPRSCGNKGRSVVGKLDSQLDSAQQDQDHTISSQEHLADEPVLVDALLAVFAGLFRPHLLDVLEHHVAVAVEGFDAREQFAVVAAGDEDLGVGAGGGHEDGEGAGG